MKNFFIKMSKVMQIRYIGNAIVNRFSYFQVRIIDLIFYFEIQFIRMYSMSL